MKNGEVYGLMNALNLSRAKGISQESINYLEDNGLIYVISSSDHARPLKKLKTMRAGLQKLESEIQSYDVREGSLKGQARAIFQGIFNRSERKEEKNQIDKKRERLERMKSGLEKLEEKGSELEAMVQTPEGFVGLTEQGETKLGYLKNRLYRLKDKPYTDFSDEIETLRATLQVRSKRFTQFYNQLSRIHEGVSFEQLISTTSRLYHSPNDPAITLRNFDEAIRNLEKLGWSENEAFVIAPRLVNLKGRDIKNSAARLTSIYNQLTKIDEETYSSGNAALSLLDAPVKRGVKSLAQNTDKVLQKMIEKMEIDEFGVNGIAARISLTKDPDLEIKRISDIYRALSKNECFEEHEIMGLAAILNNLDLSPARVARRAENIFKSIEDAQLSIGNYGIVVGALSNVPGKPNEVIDNLDIALSVLEEDEWDRDDEDVTMVATQLLVDTYTDPKNQRFFGEPVLGSTVDVPRFRSSTFSANQGNYNQHDSGFSLEGAVMGGLAGDLIDNGSLDLSGGAIFGAVAGGFLFDD